MDKRVLKKFLIGSRYFFKDIEGFNSKDVDYLIFEEEPKEYKNKMQITSKDSCLFKWRKMSVEEIISFTLKSQLPMEVGKFLVKEVNEYLGITLEDLKKLESVFNRLDEKHRYEKVIYDSYIENNDFYLTNEQLQRAYEEYKKERL